MPEESNRKRAVLFDMDGVLVLTDQLKAEAHAETVKLLGGDVPASFYGRHMGKSHQAVRQAFLTQAGITADPDEYTRIYHETYQRLLSTRLEVAPGAVSLLQRLADRGFSLGVVSSSRSWMMDAILTQTHLDRFFNVRVCSEDAERPKPAPDPYLTALKLLGAKERAAVAVEDSQSGVEAAATAGIPVLAMRHALNKEHDFTRAVAEFNSLCDTSIVDVIESLLVPAHA